MKFMSKFSDPAYALLRIWAGYTFSFHGVQKILGIMSDMPMPPVGSQLWIAGLIELVCGVLIMLGVKTRYAAFLASGEMAVAYFTFHWKFQLGPAFFPTINKGELAALYCFVFFFISTRGGVMWCFDKK